MNRKQAAAVLILLLVGTSTLFVLFPPSSDSFHFESEVPEDVYSRYLLWISGLEDCILNISFTDDPILYYSLDVELYNPYPASSAFELTVTEGESMYWVKFEGMVETKALNIVLGSGVPYELLVIGTNVTASIIYEDNAIGSSAELEYSATGPSLNLVLTEDMTFSEIGMEVLVGRTAQPDYVYLYTNLPDGVNGLAGFREPLYLQESTGWAFRSRFIDSVSYSTDPLIPEPLLKISVIAKYGIYAWLSD